MRVEFTVDRTGRRLPGNELTDPPIAFSPDMSDDGPLRNST